ncbi:hypothetical protein AQJ91_45830 [Streptomyces dysideae]|uniref:Uncharacterized protein n=1 Tax=Streptomyces dysideae TaxID=909626 RepID=A0A101UPU1_9ACTN|nr:hypothetical protein AQJ91_45830 [Streptomyces dysideae]
MAAASVLAGPRARASWLLAERPASGVVLPHAAVSEPRAVAVVWLVAARQQAAVPEVEPVWAAWVAREPVRLAEAVQALAVVEPSRSPVAVWSARPRGSLARVPAVVRACTVAAAERNAAP